MRRTSTASCLQRIFRVWGAVLPGHMTVSLRQVARRRILSGKGAAVISAGRDYSISPSLPTLRGMGLFLAGRPLSSGTSGQEAPTATLMNLAMRVRHLVLVRSAGAGRLVVCPGRVISTSTCTTPIWEVYPDLRGRQDMALSVWAGRHTKGRGRGCPLRSIYRGTLNTDSD